MARHPLRYALSQLLLQLRIISAVARREMELRAAKGLFGVVGVFLEPLVLIGTFLALRILLRGAGEGSYMNLLLWLSVGFVPFFMFAEVAIKAISGVEKNSTLYFYRRLRPLDSLMGNALLTTQIFGLLLLVITMAVTIWEWRPQVAAFGITIFVVIGIAVLGFGVGLSTLILGHRLPVVAWFVKMFLRRILLWTSCIFFPIRIVPDQFRPWILWNPLAHGIEILRQSINPAYPAPGVSGIYFWAWVIGSLGFGLFIYGNNEELLYSTEGLPAATITDED
ncbi:MAG: ABC transporter permease [Chitinophagaceae bacterium]|jgi:capsular polysaccharide transport system permease protein|nr:ABC transporter permease [Chitinophagaceae bacterium]